MNSELLVENTTKMTAEVQTQKIRLFAKIDIVTKLKILDIQKSKFHQLKSNYKDIDNNVLTLASLLLAIDDVLDSLDEISFKSIKIRGRNIKRKVKREKLLGYWAIVKTLKTEQNMSFRQMAKYFKKYHKFEVAHSTIYGLWIEIEKSKSED